VHPYNVKNAEFGERPSFVVRQRQPIALLPVFEISIALVDLDTRALQLKC
jgi:hypothetical protein